MSLLVCEGVRKGGSTGGSTEGSTGGKEYGREGDTVGSTGGSTGGREGCPDTMRQHIDKRVYTDTLQDTIIALAKVQFGCLGRRCAVRAAQRA